MKIVTVAISLSLSTTAAAFAPIPTSRASTRLSSTVEKPATASPERTAPDAGWEPDWEGREGLSPGEFMQSDMKKPDLSGMWECPLTRWDDTA